MVSKKGLKSKIGLVDMLLKPIRNQLILGATIFLGRLIFEDLRYEIVLDDCLNDTVVKNEFSTVLAGQMQTMA